MARLSESKHNYVSHRHKTNNLIQLAGKRLNNDYIYLSQSKRYEMAVELSNKCI